MARICIVSLGCDKNRIDAEIIAKKLEDVGHVLVNDPDGSDLVIVNTCGFIESSKKESIDTIFEMVRRKEDEESPVAVVAVTGCLAERYREELADLVPEADVVIGIGENDRITSIIDNALQGERIVRFGKKEDLPIDGGRILSTPGHYAYLKIAEGCSNHCTYCAIPSIRGRFRSRNPDSIVSEAGELVQNGVKELILVAQDTTVYGRDLAKESSLSELLERLAKLDGLWKIRILYAYPDNITDELIDTIAKEPKVAKYLDIPFQHADGDVLRRMGRFGDQETLLSLVHKLRNAVPGIVLRSSFIAGFPGESEEQFHTLLSFLGEARIDRAGCFAYSKEEGTPASRLKGQVPEKTKLERSDAFMERQTSILAEKQKAMVGRTFEAVCDGFDAETGMYVARTEYDAPEVDTILYVDSKAKIKPGTILRVKVQDADLFDLFGVLDDSN